MTQITFHSAPDKSPQKSRLAQRLTWYANRLRAMSVPEVGHRVVEQINRRSASLRPYGWAAFDEGTGPIPRLPIALPDPIHNQRRLVADWSAVADAATAGGLELLGQTWPHGPVQEMWHWDPISRRIWPREAYCFGIDHRGASGYGDVKFVWEYNRLQFLPPIAALAAVTGRDDRTAFCLQQLESWIDANPPFKGVNWGSGIELALRAISILTVLAFVEDSAISAALNRKLRACLAAHAFWLDRYPSKHSSANNHRVAEAAGLFLIGTLAPDLKHADTYAVRGRRALFAEVERQFHEDGVGAEQSPTYGSFTIELYLLCAWLADHVDKPFPSSMARRLGRAGEYLRWITDPASNQPRIGDDDEGRIFSSRQGRETHYVSSVLGCLASYLKRPDLAPPATPPHLRNLIFGAPPRRRPAPKGTRSFDAGGYTVMRNEIVGRNALLVMDHGPLGHLSIAAHGHADALALWLHLDDQPVLVDAGTFLYHSGSRWRDHFRSTSAHNTLSLGGASSSTMAGAFNWSHKARAWREQPAIGAGEYEMAAGHNGYQRGFGVIHRRKVSVTDNRISVKDTLLGDFTQLPAVEIGFLFHPDLDVTVEAGAVCVASKTEHHLLCMMPDPGLSASLYRAETSPPRGWYSPSFGEKCPASMVVLRPNREGDRSWTTQFVISRSSAWQGPLSP